MKNELNIMLEAAITLATQAHMGQTTWDGLPYILHPLHLMDQADTVILKIINVLHDVDEDTEVDLLHIQSALQASVRVRGEESEPEALPVIIGTLALLSHGDDSYEAYIDFICQNRLAMECKKLDLEHNMDVTRSHTLPKKMEQYIAAHKKITDKLKRIGA